ncbi:MAG: methylated-DNA--[protein]-cysteine S-methyltransferase [Deltaproteobacteria bacterium]|nr:methylated-DNA--[protein]-cysteine S-methyltransferase [Deltaproteobacteria bacterium]
MKTRIDSPIGPIVLAATSSGLTHACFESRPQSVHSAPEAKDPDARKHLDAACQVLFEYFEGERSGFDDLVLTPEGTSFQQRVWRALRSLPYGRTTTYGRVARRIRQPSAVRAVGLANGRNPIPIIVPCHRVIGANGSLTGYGGGLDRKAWLLRHEGVH